MSNNAKQEPLAVSIKTAQNLTDLGSTKLYELIKTGELETVKVGTKRLIKYPSVKRLMGVE
jgi:excisionase family DNA binding protein